MHLKQILCNRSDAGNIDENVILLFDLLYKMYCRYLKYLLDFVWKQRLQRFLLKCDIFLTNEVLLEALNK